MCRKQPQALPVQHVINVQYQKKNPYKICSDVIPKRKKMGKQKLFW